MDRTESKHIYFDHIRTSPSGKTDIWHLITKNTKLHIGAVRWAGNFRKYAFYPLADTFYDSNCLRDIAEFLEHQMEVRNLNTLNRLKEQQHEINEGQ